MTAGVHREADLLLPIIVRVDEASRNDIDGLANLQIWSQWRSG